MVQSTFQKLVKISTNKRFAKGEYIFYENQKGSDMYIVLSGKVGIFINSLLEDSAYVTEIESGGFFGEMSIFDDKPRSASAVALEETICSVVNQSSLDVLIEICPDITRSILISLSQRIRDLNDQLYKTKQENFKYHMVPFYIIGEHKSHSLWETEGYAQYIDSTTIVCPVCGKNTIMEHIKYALLERVSIERDMQTRYKGIDTLWHSVSCCNECGYANHSNEFPKEIKAPKFLVKKVIDVQNEYYLNTYQAKSPFDAMVFNYYKAIHYNQCFFPHNTLLIAKLWINLYWIYQQVSDNIMIAYARKQAITFYRESYETRAPFLTSDGNKQRCAALIGELSFLEDDKQTARYYFNEVLKYPGKKLKDQISDRIAQLREKL